MAFLVRRSLWTHTLIPSGSGVRYFSPSAELGVREFLKSVGRGVDAHSEKVDQEVKGIKGLLLIRCESLKKIKIPCKQRKLILRYTEKYRQGLWIPKDTTA